MHPHSAYFSCAQEKGLHRMHRVMVLAITAPLTAAPAIAQNLPSDVGRAGRRRLARLQRLSRSEPRTQDWKETRRIPCSGLDGQSIL